MPDDLDDFERDDVADAQVVEASTELMETVSGMPAPVDGMVAHRQALVRAYHGGSKSLVEKLNTEDKSDMANLVMALVDEVIGETDNLKGNELIATEDGNLRDASIISFKRAEVLEKAIKAVQTKQVFDKETGIDVSSPQMQAVFRFFMRKVKIVFQRMGYEDEACDTFFEYLGIAMEGWQKELQSELEELPALVSARILNNAS